MPLARGKAVKVVYALLRHLPSTEQYRVVMVEPDLEEVVDSQQAMLQRSGSTGAGLSRDELIAAYRRQLDDLKRWIAKWILLKILRATDLYKIHYVDIRK